MRQNKASQFPQLWPPNHTSCLFCRVISPISCSLKLRNNFMFSWIMGIDPYPVVISVIFVWVNKPVCRVGLTIGEPCPGLPGTAFKSQPSLLTYTKIHKDQLIMNDHTHFPQCPGWGQIHWKEFKVAKAFAITYVFVCTSTQVSNVLETLTSD